MKKSQHYPADWPTLSYTIKAANRWQCQACGRQCRRPGEMYLGWQYELTLAHITQNYEAEAVQLAPLCLPCHLRYDAAHSWLARRRNARQRQRQAGQLTLAL